jgi:1,2-diacylglycerol 3-alpha-glucosyltransferase
MKVALICPTVGQTRRGYERYVSDLFRFTRDQTDVTLFKGGGQAGPREKVVPHLTRTGLLNRICGHRFRFRRYQIEFASFAVAVAPSIVSGGYDLVHFIDPPLVRHLARLRRCSGVPFKLLFSNAGPLSYDASRWVNHIHCLSPHTYSEAIQLGISEDRLTLVPAGVDRAALKRTADRSELRRRLDVPPGQFVILAIAPLNRHHKRVDYLIEEVARLDSPCLLWVDGSIHPDGDPSLIDLGRRLLKDRFRHTHVPSESVADLYGMADVLVSAATYESFGMAISEAMGCDLPVVVHDSEHFRWLVSGRGHLVDMSIPGALTRRLSELMTDREALQRVADADAVCRRFGWPEVARQHVEMYQKVLGTGST